MTKYKVPDGMLNAASTAIDYARKQGRGRSLSYDELPPRLALEITLEAALRWLLPELERELTEVLYDCFHSLSMPSMQHMVPGEKLNYTLRNVWKEVSRMFLAPEPEVPEEIKDLLVPNQVSSECFMHPETYNQRVIEAYRRGQKSKEPE